MDADLEHVAYRYRPPSGVALYVNDGDWLFAPPEASYDMEQLAERGWQVERLYRKEGDDG